MGQGLLPHRAYNDTAEVPDAASGAAGSFITKGAEATALMGFGTLISVGLTLFF